MASHILILGAGITGLSTALALSQTLPSPRPQITIFEVRSSPSTIGGAVNLTPKALRYLDRLGVYPILTAKGQGAECRTIEMFDLYSGTRYAEVGFQGKDGDGVGREGSRYFARRVLRSEIQSALLERASATDGVDVVFGKKVVRIEETPDGVDLTFEDGETVTGDCLLGCDGIHSATRTLLVDPGRKPTYTGISVAMGMAAQTSETPPPPWTTTGLITSRRGSLMCSYFEPDKGAHFIGAVIEIADVGSREGWRVRGTDQEAIKSDLLERFRSQAMPTNEKILEAVREWTLYPVFTLPEGGKWRSAGGRAVLLGDSAHAVRRVLKILRPVRSMADICRCRRKASRPASASRTPSSSAGPWRSFRRNRCMRFFEPTRRSDVRTRIKRSRLLPGASKRSKIVAGWHISWWCAPRRGSCGGRRRREMRSSLRTLVRRITRSRNDDLHMAMLQDRRHRHLANLLAFTSFSQHTHRSSCRSWHRSAFPR